MKKKLGGINALYPSLTTIVGAMVAGKPNLITIAHVGIMNHGRPQFISLSINKAHYTNQGIKENQTFSVNIPSEGLVTETDYIGLVSGKNTDKSQVIELFYGRLETAPMITACPINMECRLDRIIDFPVHDLFIGEIVETYVDESVLQDNKIDLSRVRPLLFDMSGKNYWALGKVVAQCWNIGKTMKTKGTA